MTLKRFRMAGVTLLSSLLAFAVTAGTNVANTVHNMTPTGPGNFKATLETGLCVFCHTPHRASPQGPLWNRELSGATYQIYTSSTMQAQVKQPTGSSRLCLSCHDGTLALGTVRNPDAGSSSLTGFLTGKSNLGTNLSADHPISFVYDAALASSRGELAHPTTLVGAVKIDKNQEMQCTSCHDPHEDKRPKFIRTETRYGALCLNCHLPNGWTTSTHATSTAVWSGVGTSPWPVGAFASVAENACSNCHKTHSAGHDKALLAQAGEVTNCLVCHNGNVANHNLQGEFAKLSIHPVNNSEWVHTPNEDATQMARHVTCADCHNPHQSNNITATTPNVTGRLTGVKGVTQFGTSVKTASYEFEVCYKCHGLTAAQSASFQRLDNVRNVRLQFDPANPSYHPVAAIGKYPDIQNLMTGYTATSRIGCGSCHNNDTTSPTGNTPSGPHGSNFAPILERQYDMADNTVETPQSYALCYKCHDRNALTTDLPGKFPHARHLAQGTACASCHDAHGSRLYPRLINFMLFDKNGIPVVSKSTVQQRLEYVPSLNGGQCYLSCHGVNHEPATYP